MLRGTPVRIVIALILVGAIVADGVFGVSPWWYAGIAVGYLMANAAGSIFINSQYFLPARCHGDSGSDAIAITFDDGPIPGKTEKILDILREHRVPATFFCIGARVEKQQALVRRIHEEGHLIGNHSYFHGKMFDLQSSQRMERELIDTNRTIQKAIGQIPKFFRPPYGVTNPMLAKAVSRLGLTAIGWNVRSLDTVIRKKEVLMKRVTRNLRGGDLLLFHDHAPATLDMLPEFLSAAKQKGLTFARLDTFLEETPYE